MLEDAIDRFEELETNFRYCTAICLDFSLLFTSAEHADELLQDRNNMLPITQSSLSHEIEGSYSRT
ncbi:MAG TPA: hypothetical protein VIQ04_07765 [Nitrososphaeraceae archaeon]